ncbi:MAG: hypothetical protein JNK04_07505 [Myxococcales bacterium]|nr:hypothetical protein [Myxococcales bacterium]
MTLALPKEAFLALAALGWADGRMTAVEKAGLLRASKECGLGDADTDVVAMALVKESSLADFVPGDMTQWQRIVTYALGSWFARLDGVMSTEEHESLKLLAKRLDLDKAVCERASAAAFDISVLPDGGKPDKFDFGKLEARLREKLPQYTDK